ncbi:Zinc knuckle CX2CX4HX4C [Senna tora]|uniref:Zinc knuckle CX2CX4HX4C n=1 Tax=Senna tora TaxID=362788 RepID=A0A834XEM8_9FABA|nr:Zinc knuckle CX2CX4HX4C [Senna tora]
MDDSLPPIPPPAPFPGRAPVIHIDMQIVAQNRDFWEHCFIGFLIDKRKFRVSRLQYIINISCHLMGRVGRRYVIYFEHLDDLYFMYSGGPWSVHSALLKLGALAGTVLEVDWAPIMPKNLRLMRIRVMVPIHNPLLLAILLNLDSGESIWIDCSYDRLYKFCKNCVRMGHVHEDCRWTREEAMSDIDNHIHRIKQEFSLELGNSLTCAHFINDVRTFINKNNRRSTDVTVIDTPNGPWAHSTFEVGESSNSNKLSQAEDIPPNAWRLAISEDEQEVMNDLIQISGDTNSNNRDGDNCSDILQQQRSEISCKRKFDTLEDLREEVMKKVKREPMVLTFMGEIRRKRRHEPIEMEQNQEGDTNGSINHRKKRKLIFNNSVSHVLKGWSAEEEEGSSCCSYALWGSRRLFHNSLLRSHDRFKLELSRTGEDAVWEKLDIALCNAKWLEMFPMSLIEAHPITASDHSPICIAIDNNVQRGRKCFKFESLWFKNLECKNIIRTTWNVNVAGSRAYQLALKLSILQQQVKEQERFERRHLEHLLECEQALWAQRAHQSWLIHGDSKTRGHMLKELNQTNISLIPKVDCPDGMADYSPIGLYNVSYKIISKNDLITPFQSAFIKGRNIADNILIAGKVLKYICRSKKGLKLNFKKCEVKFSPNTPRRFAKMMGFILKSKVTTKIKKYLGRSIDGDRRGKE